MYVFLWLTVKYLGLTIQGRAERENRQNWTAWGNSTIITHLVLRMTGHTGPQRIFIPKVTGQVHRHKIKCLTMPTVSPHTTDIQQVTWQYVANYAPRYAAMLTRPAPSRPRPWPWPWPQGQGLIPQGHCIKAKTEQIKLTMQIKHSSVCNFFDFIKWLNIHQNLKSLCGLVIVGH